MFSQTRMNALAERRQLLLLEAELHRSLIALECETLRARLAGLRSARAHLAAGGPWLVAGGAVAGFLAIRHWRKLAGWIPAALTAFRWVESLKVR
jgi:hypothetical protein